MRTLRRTLGPAWVLVPLLPCLVLALLHPTPALAQSGNVDEITVQGLFRMTDDAFRHALGVTEGDPYDAALIQRQFRKLWDLGLFQDIVIEAEPSREGGTVLVVKVKERPVLTSVTFDDSSAISRTDIEDQLRDQDAQLKLGKPLDQRRIFKAKQTITDALGAKGFLDAKVEADERKVTESSRAVHFFITPGGKTRVRKIDFQGNELYSDRVLKKQLRLTQERRWFWPWSSKNLYHPAKWDQDVLGVSDLYRNIGYLNIDVRPPLVEVKGNPKAERKTERRLTELRSVEAEVQAINDQLVSTEADLNPVERAKLQKQKKRKEKRARRLEKKASKVKRWVQLTVPITEGDQYQLGEITIVGAEVFEGQTLRPLVPLREGDIFRNSALDSGISLITRLYEDRGHLYARVVRTVQPREDELIADVEISVEEEDPYYVGRIEFRGNTETRDAVLRREMLISEGDLFNRSLLDVSKVRVNQLGYYQVPEEPIIEPVEDETRVNIAFNGEEQGRNEVQFGGGYSGLDGAFFSGVYSTRNFLGRGQTVSAAIQVGGRSNRYSLSFFEPWFLNRSIQFGFQIFRQDFDFGTSLDSTETGFGITLGKRLRGFSSFSTAFNWRDVNSRQFLFPVGATAADAVSVLESQNTVASLTPSFVYNTVNNPYRPTRGQNFTAQIQIAGGPLGGDTSYLRPQVLYTNYFNGPSRGFFGFHAEVAMVTEWQGGSDNVSANIEGVPRFARFWLGGDTHGPRVFETRSITPLRYVLLDQDGQIVSIEGDARTLPVDELVTSGNAPALIEVGGDRSILIQSEYVFPFNEQAELALFVDVGNVMFEDQSWGLQTARISAGIELRFHLPVFPVPLRLIYGVPVRKLSGDRTSSFTFSIGRSF